MPQVMKAALKYCPASTKMLELAIENRANLESFGQLHDSPPLVEACTLQNIGAMEYLLNAAADVNQAQASTQMTALHRGALACDEAALSMLLQHGANVSATFQYNR